MQIRRPSPLKTASTLLRRHGEFATVRVVELIRQTEQEARPAAAWWGQVFDAVWLLSAETDVRGQQVH